jgi:hypothetical protein
MTTFAFTELVNSPMADITSAALGVNAAGKFTANDVGKLVKLAGSNNYVLCADGNEIEGIVVALAPETVNDGFSLGSVMKNKRFTAEVVGATVAVGATVVSAAQSAIGTADAKPKVKAGAPVTHIWRVISLINGVGTAGSPVLVERV